VGEDRTEGAQQGESPKEYVSVGEAAKFLGIHRNTVHHRIKTGRITAHKVVEGGREIYRVETDSLGVGRTSAHVHTLDAQRTTASEELSRMIATRLDEIVRVYTHELGPLREELGAERARREMAETTLREGMAEEQRRREEAERERDDLRRAELQLANLQDANLQDANLREAYLREAYLQGADLQGADLQRAKVTGEQLADTRALQGAIMPDGQKYEDWMKDIEGRGKDRDNE
jgi:excisionase family DNA binding protein